MKYLFIVLLAICSSCERAEEEEKLTCSFVAPSNDLIIGNDIPIQITINTSTPVDQVDVYFNEEHIKRFHTHPYELTWTPMGKAAGNHVLIAVATHGKDIASSTCRLFINYSLGELSQGGTIYFIDETGRHGLVVANQDIIVDEETNLFWGPETFLNATDTVDGNENTVTLANSPHMESFFWNRFKLGYIHNGYSDWYIPSKTEFILLAEYMDQLEETDPAYLQDTYWTSTECCRAQACAIDFVQRKAISGLKADNSFRVRPVRKF